MTKDVCKQRARDAYGLGSSVHARRSFTTWWIVEVRDPAERIVMEANQPTLRLAYSEIAARLGGRIERAS